MSHPATARERGLAAVTSLIEEAAAGSGWDGPLRVFALVATAHAARADAEFAAQLLEPDLAKLPEGHLTPVEQQELPEAESLEELLARLAWPETVGGAAVVVERVILVDDDGAAVGPQDVLTSPDRRDVRIAAGVIRSGESWCVLRLRDNDDAAMRLQGPDVVPGLVELLRGTLAPIPGDSSSGQPL
ncbi:MAG TPA: PPA1309 family protein [Actinomycetaceae bacterium]|nr:PPA1309 family protein [Actinomycetaceae bacterium]